MGCCSLRGLAKAVTMVEWKECGLWLQASLGSNPGSSYQPKIESMLILLSLLFLLWKLDIVIEQLSRVAVSIQDYMPTCAEHVMT